MAEKFCSIIDSPVGRLQVIADASCILEVRFEEQFDTEQMNPSEITAEGARQLSEYFSGKRRIFELPLSPLGTAFRRRVWNELQRIPFASTITYAELAKRLGDLKCIRAAGTANGKNPIPVIIPCHRVIGSDGSMTGFGGGIKRKQMLLEHEQKVIGNHLLIAF